MADTTPTPQPTIHPSGQPEMGKDSYDHTSGWIELEDVFNEDTDSRPDYPFNNVTQTESGHIFELDDTPKRERVKLMHRTGTFIEMFPDGSEVHKVYGDGYEITIKNKNVHIKGRCSITIDGDSITHIKGDKLEKIDGDYEMVIMGNYNTDVKGKIRIISEKQMDLIADPIFGGVLNISVGSTVHINGDVMIEGRLTSDYILSTTRVDAQHGVFAGPAGFVTMLGGVSVGIPIAVPGNITTIGNVNAGISVNSPLAFFGVSTSGLMTDTTNVPIYNIHRHKGAKSGPRPRMI
jgi:hypothetical protein